MNLREIPAAEALLLLSSSDVRDGSKITGVLNYSGKENVPASFPDDLQVDVLNLSGRKVPSLPRRLSCYELNLSNTNITQLPDDLRVRSRLDLSNCEHLERLPAGLTVGTLILRGCTRLTELPEGLDVWFLDLTGCWAFENWPKTANIRSGRLQLRGCTALRTLPPYLNRLSALNVRDCPNLTALPPDLKITGWLDLGHSGLKDEAALPPSLAKTQLRWAGINVDRRIVFHPDQITTQEVLVERNAERRRVLIDCYGYGRFLRDANAEVLDKDQDRGGERQLLRMKLDGDEDLVAMACFCPSTGNQYVIRVPPTTPTCHHAAAWIAGFDNPDDYQPIQET